jgi:tetratricopeptide (TPR) repeat protein
LITDLSQSKHIKILSAERLFDILHQTDQLGKSTYTSEVLKEVAAMGGVESVLVGNYTRANSTFRINVTLQEASSGELIGSESVEGHGEKDFYVMVDELTRRIKENFELSEAQIATDIDEEVGKITTASPEAYKHYSLGRTYHLNGDYQRSIESMLKAVEIDPEFAMAYRSMASAYGNLGYRPARLKARQKAFELRDRVSDRERFLIEGDYYWTSEKTLDKAVEAYSELLELYPDDPIALTNLGGVYYNLEEWDRCLEQHKIHFQYKPVNYIVYWNLIEVYMVKGMYDIARQVMTGALNDYPDLMDLYNQSTLIYASQGEYDSALDEVDKAISLNGGVGELAFKGDIFILKENISEAENIYKKFAVDTARAVGFIKLYLLQGKFDEIKTTLEQVPALQTPLAHLYLKTGEFDKALVEFDKRLDDAVKNDRVRAQIFMLYLKGKAYLGKKSIPDAEKTAGELKEFIQVNLFKKLIRLHHHLMGVDGRREFRALFINSLAEAHYQAGDLEKALEEYKKISSLTFPRIWDGDIYAKSFYMMGKIYESTGKKVQAREAYSRFLELWKDADPGFPEVLDARKRLEAL